MKLPKIVKTTLALGLFLIPIKIYAEDTTVADILGTQEIDTEIIAELDDKEEAREDGFETQLLLQIPELTDNPSHILTFTDPSEEKVGVQLEIDNTKYIEIDSPYALPALGIGQHQLKFKFTDDEGSAQTLEKELTVIPRPPILNTPQITKENITIKGTGLANSEIIILLTSDAYNTTETVDIDKDGIWSHTFAIEEKDNTLYNISAYTRKYGFASNLSEVLTFNTDTSLVTSTKSNTVPEIEFSIESLTNPAKVYIENLDFSIYTAIIFILGIVIALGISSILKNGKEASEVKKFKKKIDTKKTPKEETPEMTLRERLSQETSKKEKKKTKQKKSEKAKEKETVVSKDQFMKDFKNFDPDKDNGKENKVKISLTSKDH